MSGGPLSLRGLLDRALGLATHNGADKTLRSILEDADTINWGAYFTKRELFTIVFFFFLFCTCTMGIGYVILGSVWDNIKAVSSIIIVTAVFATAWVLFAFTI